MPSSGPNYPTTMVAATVGSELEVWVNPTNVGADDAAEAQVTAATFDANDISQQLRTSGYGFAIPTGAIIDGIVVEIERRSIVGSGEDFRVQLRDDTGTLVGTNKADTVTAWPGTATIALYGGTTDTWAASPTAAMVNDPDFGVVLSSMATATNTDIGVDFIRITVYYTVPAALDSASMADADRNWDTPYQNIALTFNEAVDITPAPSVGDTVAGLTAQVNGGANAALTYVSGNGTASWKVRRAELIQQNDTVVLDYDQTTGIILAVDDSAEIDTVTDLAVTNNLTKRIRETIKDAAGTALNAVTVKYGIFQYDSGAPANANWMTRDTKGTAATDATGILDVEYTGSVAPDGTVYLVVIQPDTSPTESMVWISTVL